MNSKPCLTLEDCKKIGAAAEAEARKNKWNVTIAILDDGGHILWLVRMDGATPFNAQVAIEKAQNKDFSEIDKLLKVLEKPFDEQPENEQYAALPPDWASHLEVSCSS